MPTEFEQAQAVLKRVRDELLECHLEIDRKSIEESNGDLLIAGYASTGDVDRMDDIIEPSAFKRTAAAFLERGTILGHHNPTIAVGDPEDVDVREKGFWLKARIVGGYDPASPEGRIYHGVKRGIIKAYSVGFQIISAENQESEKGGWKIERVKRRITDLDLYETSVVTIPANRKTFFKLSKAVSLGTDNPDRMYAEHRVRAALDLFGGVKTPDKKHEENDEDRIVQTASLLVLRAAAGDIARRGALPGAHYLRGSVGE